MELEGQQQFVGATDAIDINAFYEWPRGWHLCIRTRAQFQGWQDVSPDLYDGLTTDELADVVLAAIVGQLGESTRS